MNSHAITLSESFSRITALDLEAVKFKLAHSASGEWTRERVDAAEREYKRFLMLVAKFPAQRFVPAGDIDDFWHGHILDTRAYAADCTFALGYFLHHWPYSGMMGDEDAETLRANFAKTCELYFLEFGEPYVPGGKASSCHDCDGGGHVFPDTERPRPRLARLDSDDKNLAASDTLGTEDRSVRRAVRSR